jgi:hypothetical protein
VLEAVFVALLSHLMPQAELLAALVAYRVIYYLAPLGIATALYAVMEAHARKLARTAAPGGPAPAKRPPRHALTGRPRIQALSGPIQAPKPQAARVFAPTLVSIVPKHCILIQCFDSPSCSLSWRCDARTQEVGFFAYSRG